MARVKSTARKRVDMGALGKRLAAKAPAGNKPRVGPQLNRDVQAARKQRRRPGQLALK